MRASSASARAGMIAPDEATFAYLKGRTHAPSGERWDEAVAYWRSGRLWLLTAWAPSAPALVVAWAVATAHAAWLLAGLFIARVGRDKLDFRRGHR